MAISALDSKQPRAQLLVKVDSRTSKGRGQAGSALRTHVPDVWCIHGMENGVAVCCSEAWVHARPHQPRRLAWTQSLAGAAVQTRAVSAAASCHSALAGQAGAAVMEGSARLT